MIRKDDKRSFIRMSIESAVIFTRPGSTEEHSGKTVDLSATGLRFITKTPVKVGEILDITVKPALHHATTGCNDAVVRVVETEDGQYDVAGVTKTNAPE